MSWVTDFADRLDARIDELEPLVEELRLLRAARKALGDAPKKPKPSAEAAPPEPEKEAEPKPPAETKGDLSVEQVRDFAVAWEREHHRPFKTTDVMERFGVSRSVAKRRIEQLVGPTLHQLGRARGTKYEWVPPQSSGPHSRPRGEPVMAGRRGGKVVPLTGKAKGPSGKPGLDRRRGRAGHRVKRARMGT